MALCNTGLLACHLVFRRRQNQRGRNQRRRNERGFALLLVFLMAAVVAITLYMELPRIAMQSQRDKEETLIDRGEQYKRAIQLFVNKAKRYPGDIKELESFQNQRFLRHRYIDPMTGKDEWRLIHIQNGILTDSKLTKPTGPGKEGPAAPNTFVGELAGLAGAPNPTLGGGAASARDRRRPSEGGAGTMPGEGPPGGNLSGGQNSGIPPLPGQGPDGLQPPLPGTQPFPAGQTPVAGQPVAGQPVAGQPVAGQLGQPVVPPGMTVPQGFPPQQYPGQPGMPGQPGVPVMPGITGGRGVIAPPGTIANSGSSFVGGGGGLVGTGGLVGGGSLAGTQPTYPGQTLPGQPGPPVNSQGGGVSPAYPTAPGSNGNPAGFPQPGATAGGDAARLMIQNILTTARPGGMPQTNPGTQTIGGGIAGVASNGEGEGVKVYNDHTLYQEWEFIFDSAKQKQIPNPNITGVGGTPADRMNPGQPAPIPGMGGQPAVTPGMGPQIPRPPGQ